MSVVCAREDYQVTAKIPEVPKEFEIRFNDVSLSDQEAIRETLKQMQPPQHCVEDFSFEVRFSTNGRFQVGCRGTHSGRRCLPFDIDEREPQGIADRLKQLISDCWQ